MRLAKSLELIRKQSEKKFLNEEFEWMDVTIRCYLLAQAISEALEEVEDEFNAAHENSEEE